MGYSSQARRIATGLVVVFAAATEANAATIQLAANTSISSSSQGSSSQVPANGNVPNVPAPQMKGPLSLRPAGRETSGNVNPGQNVMRPAGSLSAAAAQGGAEVKPAQPLPK
jgi:hypothetical protein